MATAIITVGPYTLISQQVVCSMLVADWNESRQHWKLILKLMEDSRAISTGEIVLCFVHFFFFF